MFDPLLHNTTSRHFTIFNKAYKDSHRDRRAVIEINQTLALIRQCYQRKIGLVRIETVDKRYHALIYILEGGWDHHANCRNIYSM